MKQIVTIKVNPQYNNGSIDKHVEAEIVGGFAIHPALEDSKLYKVTHLKSGLGCIDCPTVRQAKAKIRLLNQIEVGGVKLADMSACEALATWPESYRQFCELNKRAVNDFEIQYGIEVRNWVADTLACSK